MREGTGKPYSAISKGSVLLRFFANTHNRRINPESIPTQRLNYCNFRSLRIRRMTEAMIHRHTARMGGRLPPAQAEEYAR
jgi:hypothetical protein